MKALNIALSALFGVALSIFVILSSFAAVVFNGKFFDAEFSKLEISQSTGISESDLKEISVKIMDYLDGKIPSLDMKYEVNGEMREIFDGNEKSHMKDVLDLFIFAKILYFCTLAYLLLFIAFKIYHNRRDALKKLSKCCLITFASLIGIFALLGLAVVIDFQGVFKIFHKLLFTNDNWMFPYGSLLITILPEQFFIDVFVTGAIILGCAVVVLSALSATYILIMRKMDKRSDKWV